MNEKRRAGIPGARNAGAPRRRTWPMPVLAALCLGLPLLASCAGHPETNPAAEPGGGSDVPLVLTLSKSDPKLIRTNSAMGGASMQALLTGTLGVGRGNCLGVATDKGTAIPAFPQTAVLLDGGRPGIEIQGRQYLVGDQVSFGGGLTVLDDGERRALEPCLGQGETDIFLIESFGP